VTGFDFVVLGVLGVSVVLGLIRGLLKEVLSLAAYAFAFVAAIWWGPRVADWLASWITQSFLRMTVAYIGVFIAVLLSIGLVNMTLSTLIDKTGLTPADHGLGAVFGLARGILFVLLFVTLAGFTPLPEEPWWKQAMFSKQIVGVVQQIKARLPDPIRDWLPY
jgi:membrane protein required for colicin V production